jgi:hypothetical protein
MLTELPLDGRLGLGVQVCLALPAEWITAGLLCSAMAVSRARAWATCDPRRSLGPTELRILWPRQEAQTDEPAALRLERRK